MALSFNYVRAESGAESIVLFVSSTGPRIIPSNHVNYEAIKDLLFDNVPSDVEDEVVRLANATTNVVERIQKLSERVSIRGSQVLFDGDPVESKLTEHIVDMIRNGDDNYQGYVLFLENLSLNPSDASRESLFTFLNRHELVITEDGMFLGYKFIGQDGLSVHSGNETVLVNGEEHTGRIPNPVGATVEMARSLVDANPHSACSVGLHVGNYRYANTYGYSSHKFLTVKVNPRDVVAVPFDSNGEKIRTCRYTVIEENQERTQYAGTSFFGTPVPADVPEDFVPDEEHEDDIERCAECSAELTPSEDEVCDDCQPETCNECGADLPTGDEGTCEGCTERLAAEEEEGEDEPVQSNRGLCSCCFDEEELLANGKCADCQSC